MKPQCIDRAIPTSALPFGVCPCCDTVSDERKSTPLDLLYSTGQVFTALGLCWMVHCFV